MKTAKIFKNGGSQAVRLPKDCQFSTDEVCVRKIGHLVMLYPPDKAWEIFKHGLSEFTPDFTVERDRRPPEERQPL